MNDDPNVRHPHPFNSVPDTHDHKFGYTIPEMDVEAFLNLRDWLDAALVAKGAVVTGGGIGMGQADTQIRLDGCDYSVSIMPLPRRD